MKIQAANMTDYIDSLKDDRKSAMTELRSTIAENIPDGFSEAMSYGMPGWVVPLSIFPPGYHCKKEEPLPFVSIASQKNFIALYHMGMYANPELLNWFVEEYPKHVKSKLDMGKSCVRFKKIDQIPYALIGELMSRMSCDEWINTYEENLKK